MHPLAIDVQQVGVAESLEDNIRTNMQRGLPEIAPAFYFHDGTFVIVGSGPSLPDFIEEIKQEKAKGRTIVAIKGAHDFLCEHGIEPDLFISVEPRDRRNNLQRKNQHTVYLLASRVNTDVFEHLKDCKVMLWHSWSMERECRVFKGKFAIGGGTTSGLRAINIGYILGFRKFKMYGMDSCLAKDGETKRFTGEKAGKIIDVHVGGKKFLCTLALAVQANEFQELYNIMPDAHIEAVGDGLIAAILDERKRLGSHT